MKKVISLFVVMSMLCCIVQVNTFSVAVDTVDDLSLSDNAPLALGVNYNEAGRYENADDPYEFAEEKELQFAENHVIVKISDAPVTLASDDDDTFFGVEVTSVEEISNTYSISCASDFENE